MNTGLVAYDLQAPAKNLYPFFAPSRNVVAELPLPFIVKRDRAGWVVCSSYDGWVYRSFPFSEVWRSSKERKEEVSKRWAIEFCKRVNGASEESIRLAKYVTIDEEDSVAYQAISAARSFDDLQSESVFHLLQKMMMKEEEALLSA